MAVHIINQYIITKLPNATIVGMANPPTGVLFYDTTNNVLMYYDNTAWKTISTTI